MAVHILAVLAIEPARLVSSDLIARSVGTNSVVVRRILSQLQKAGLVTSQAGVGGGARLNVDPTNVSLLTVYDAVDEGCFFKLHEPSDECPVAVRVRDGLEQTVETIVGSLRDRMEKIPLAELTEPAVEEYRKWRQSKAADERCVEP